MLPRYFVFLDRYENNIIENNITNLGVIYRNYTKIENLTEISRISSYCKKKGFKFYISNNFKLAKKIKADGLYIPAFNKNMIFKKLDLCKNFKIIGSAHNQIEIKRKKEQGCEAIFLSPLFQIKKKTKYLGICRFNLLTLNQKIEFIALGGITKSNINNLKMLKVIGMAGISYFKKKTGLNF